MFLRLAVLSSALCGLCAGPLRADEVTEVLDAALQAYEAGDTQAAVEGLTRAIGVIEAEAAAPLADFLPEPPEGWTREIDPDMAENVATMGGGTGAEALYRNKQESFTLTLIADNAMVRGLAGKVDTGAPGPGQERVQIGGQDFSIRNGEVVGLINGRVLVQASGAPREVILPLLERMDLARLGRAGR